MFIKDRHVCVKPLRSRIEVIQQLKPPTKGCRSFAGMVNFVSIYCPELQKLLKPIYELTKKGRHFIWGKEQQEAFDEIKARPQKTPVLSMPDKRDSFTLYSDTSKHATVMYGGCYVCVNLRCLGVRCCIGAPRYTMLIFGFPFFGC